MNEPVAELLPEPSSKLTPSLQKAQEARRQKPRTLSKAIRSMVDDDPRRIANILFDILENVSGKERSSDRIAAAKELFDRGWGKAPAYAPVEGADPLETDDLDAAIREIAQQLTKPAHPTLDAEVIGSRNGDDNSN